MARIWNKHKVLVAMSGGVDSSVAAALLKKQGHNVVGVFMKPWTPDHKTWSIKHGSRQDDSRFRIQVPCPWKQDREDAMRAAAVLGIPFKTWDFSREYKKSVTDYMIREYKAGRTPNPDVMCNKEIKFGLFLKKALEEGADYIATGHYVRLRRKFSIFNFQFSKKFKIQNSKLEIARDRAKDQSYFLWTLTQNQLRHCLFPIGNHTKPEVRKMAKKFGLLNHAKKDSQGVCFIGPLDMKSFLTAYIKPKSGKIMDQKDNIIGTHDGVYYYTIGQRHGLNISNGQGPYYVTGKDIKGNIIYVGANSETAQKEARVNNFSWTNGGPPAGGFPALVDVKVRYRAPSVKAILKKGGTLEFKKPERAVTSGQSAVFYRGKELLGGGIIS